MKLMMNRYMVVGPVGSGKSSLLLALKGEKDPVLKTQAVEYKSYGVDTPGEYLENPRMYRFIISLAQEVKCVLLIQDVTNLVNHYPPEFVSSIPVPVIGVITKSDSMISNTEVAKSILKNAGVKGPIFVTSSKSGEGLEHLIQYLRTELKIPAAEFLWRMSDET